MDQVVFWLVAPVGVGAAVAMLFQRNAVYAALFLILNQFTLAVMFALLGAHFLAAVQVIVYAGAIMVLFLFVIMFLGVDRREALIEPLKGQRFLAVTLGLLLIGTIVASVALGAGAGEAPIAEAPADDVEAVGRTLFTRYVLPFEVTSVLLIIAAVAAMVLARRKARGLPDEDAEPPAGAPAPPERETVP